jgi:hypothetical protein
MGLQVCQIVNNFSLGGIAFNASAQLTADVQESTTYSVPVAQTGTLTTRTDNDTGTLTMASGGHGITTGARLDIYWTGGCRRGMVVGTVSGTTVPIDLGSGDNLPIATTTIQASVPIKKAFALIVANAVIFAMTSDFECQFTFLQADLTTENYTQHLVPTAAVPAPTSLWYSAYGANPMTGTLVAWVYMSHADPAAVHTMSAAAMA